MRNCQKLSSCAVNLPDELQTYVICNDNVLTHYHWGAPLWQPMRQGVTAGNGFGSRMGFFPPSSFTEHIYIVLFTVYLLFLVAFSLNTYSVNMPCCQRRPLWKLITVVFSENWIWKNTITSDEELAKAEIFWLPQKAHVRLLIQSYISHSRSPECLAMETSVPAARVFACVLAYSLSAHNVFSGIRTLKRQLCP